MTIYPDPTLDYKKHKERINFDQIVESGNIDKLMNFVEAFIRRGHDPHDPRDEMYAIMGISPQYLDFIQHDMAQKKLADTDVFFNKAAKNPKATPQIGPNAQHGHAKQGRGKRQSLGLTIDED